ncbi:MAG: hypothetical protein ACLP8X_39775 [Streptosporangiaceae bacterium]
MSGAVGPAAELKEAIGQVRTFGELGAQIGNSGFTGRWKRDGIWATEVLAEALGEDWPGRFQARSGPYLKFVLAPYRLPQLASTVELAARLRLLTGSPGLADVRRHMRTQLEPGVMGHANLQLEVAALEKRRSGTAALEAGQGPGRWKPDVMLSDAGTPIGVECLRLSVADDVASHLGTPGAPEKAADGWQRIAARIFVKAGQPAEAGGWLRCELDDGMFAGESWFTSELSAMSLEGKAATLAEGACEAMQTTGSIHGIVLSSPAASGLDGQDETCRLPACCIALRRRFLGERTRETFIIPSDHAAESEPEMWTGLYENEPTWLDWVMPAVRGAEEDP